jgi:uncharacterized protein (DUF1501 family)
MHRREFLRHTTGLLALGAMASPTRLLLAQDNTPTEYKCLVNIFFFGGNDSFNLVVPSSNAEYNIYASARQNLAIAQADLLPITADNPDGATYGLHPNASGIQALFEQGDAAIVANMGPMVEPVTKSSYLGGEILLPPQLFSHNDQQDQWLTLKGLQSVRTGWGGRMADVLQPVTNEQQLALNVSTFGISRFQAGSMSVPYALGTEGPTSYGAFKASAINGTLRGAEFERYLSQPIENVHARALAEVHRRSLATGALVTNSLALAPTLTTVFPMSYLGQQLKIIARMIAVKDELSMSRQVFFADAGGFDTHDNQNIDQPKLIDDISGCITAFNAAMIEIGMADSVVLFTESDFGRTLTSNGDGTDHGWGGHQFVVGGPVRGRKIYGTMPTLEIGGADDVGGGRIVPTTSVDTYAATLASWFGVADSDLTTIAPNLENFPVRNLGLFSA